MPNRPGRILFGTSMPQRAPVELRAGPLDLLFDENSGFLRRIRQGSVEVLRGIYVSVRDAHWGTLRPVLSSVSIESGESGFRISYRARCSEGEIDFAWTGIVEGSRDGEIHYSMDGEALTGFRKNRVGFCVLHPVRECAGKACTIKHTDGLLEESRFPTLISPHQPFTQVRAIDYEPRQGLHVHVEFEGDAFETEDQRNWADASFKTYCTPQSVPFPVFVNKGKRIRQSIHLRLSGEIESRGQSSGDAPVRILKGEGEPVSIPTIGLASSGKDPSSAGRLELLKRLNLSHLRTDVFFDDPDWKSSLSASLTEASAVGAGLELVLHVTDAAERELRGLRDFLLIEKPMVVRCIVLHRKEDSTSARWLRIARTILEECVTCPFGTGTDAHFTELNRDHSAVGSSDFLCYPLNPQVHLADYMTVLENLAAQADTVRTAREFAGRRPVVVTPVTLAKRCPADELDGRQGADPLQASLLGAAWTVGSLKYLTESGAGSITLFETTGPRGVLASDPVEGADRVFPLYFAIAAAGRFCGGKALVIQSSHPEDVLGMFLYRGNRSMLLLANLASRKTHCDIDSEVTRLLSGGVLRIKMLGLQSVDDAARHPGTFLDSPGTEFPVSSGPARIGLEPHALAWVEAPGDGRQRPIPPRQEAASRVP